MCLQHTGVPNVTLVKENSLLANLYKNKSVAEQNSVDLAWKLLEEGPFSELRQCIYRCNGSDEHRRFRQLVVQAVLATDIADKELKVISSLLFFFNTKSIVFPEYLTISGLYPLLCSYCETLVGRMLFRNLLEKNSPATQ